MIQRIQSIFLLLITVVMTAVIFAPIWSANVEGKEATLTALQLVVSDGETVNTIAIAIVSGLSAFVAAISLFSFKNRMNQMKLNLLNSVLIFATIGLIFYYGYFMGAELVGGEGKFAVGFFLPVFSIVFNSLANRFIQRDEKKVRDSVSGRLRD
ncbi:DUF4293 family protein [Flammeovirga pectinis]|uniref:DUF4293 family protein n=1 Tax=Flammeovirga pectinis TaxID=2494373 RepID=A0A3S9P588_9BACT|nr:DUF4293 domain-containing protein [Flammeovirga pectinis]AZQ63371.1 DUF4293 family protein [Flammeovirga pectinis]